MKHRYTPDNIGNLESNEVFVYGANTSWRHGKGAAKTAVRFGARWGQGPAAGRTYGIPTKNDTFKVLSLSKISKYIDDFIEFSKIQPELVFLVTKIGCGLAGYTPEDIAPLFKNAIGIENIILPKEFVYILEELEKQQS